MVFLVINLGRLYLQCALRKHNIFARLTLGCHASCLVVLSIDSVACGLMLVMLDGRCPHAHMLG